MKRSSDRNVLSSPMSNASAASEQDAGSLRDKALAAGRVVVTLPDGSTEVRDPAPPAPRERRRRRKRKEPDPFVTTARRDRRMTAEQRSELAALSRDRFLNFSQVPTLTRGEAERLIPKLRRLAKTRQTAQLHQLRQHGKPNKRRQILVVK